MPKAQRVVSLLPSATEWVCKLGFADRLVGVSHECDFPGEVTNLPKVTASKIDATQSSREIDEAVRSHSDARTSLYDLDESALRRLQPDLVITQSLCNVCAVDRDLVADVISSLDCRVLDLHAVDLDQVLADGELIAESIGQTDESRQALKRLSDRISAVRHASRESDSTAPRVTLLEWTDPLFCSGHWTPQLIEWAGATDPVGVTGQPSRVISRDELCDADPDLLLVACCGLDLQRTQHEWSETLEQLKLGEMRAVESDQVHCFDGSAWFNRSGPRLVDALEAIGGLVDRWRAAEA